MNARVDYATPAATQEQLDALGIRKISHFEAARQSMHPLTRLETVRQSALKFRDHMLNLDSRVTYYRSIDLIRAPYPVRYGLYNAAKVTIPYMHILNRVFVVQFMADDGLKTLLFSPSDIEGNRETPFFKRLVDRVGPLSPIVGKFLAPIYNDVESALTLAGIEPEDVDYISFDHLHTQDIRRWLGTKDIPAYFPNARLLVMQQEWESTRALLPPQAEWYCPHGIEGVPAEKVVLLDSSVMLGNSVALVQTPGHTEGNHSLVAHTDDGLLVTSENGVAADSYSPRCSRIPGVREYARQTGMEVILNGNTQESSIDQYISMVMEKTIAGPAKANPDFFNFVPSSELTYYWGFPGLAPSFSFGQLQYGSVRKQ